jgi:hypothetical protein
MTHYLLGPEWFYSIESIFETFSFIVTGIIAFYAYKLYKFSEKKNYLYFSLSFIILSFGFLFKVLTHLVIHLKLFEHYDLGTITISATTFNNLSLIYIFGHLIARFLILLGFLGIYMVIYKKNCKKDIFFMSYLMAIVAIIGHYKHILFYFTLAILLGLIVAHYYSSFRKKGANAILLVGSSFFFLLLSNVFFIALDFGENIYVLGEVVQLAGFLLLLGSYVMILRDN